MTPALQWACIEAVLDPTLGPEQQVRRPVLVVSNEPFNQAMPSVTVIPLTSVARDLYPAEVFLPEGIAGQPLASIAMAHQIRTITKERLVRPLGYLDDPELRSAVANALREHLDLT